MVNQEFIQKRRRARNIDIIIDIPFFDKITEDDLNVIADHLIFMEIDKDEILFKEGDKGDSVYFVVAGELEVIKETNTPAKKVVITTIQKNRPIGEMSIIDSTPRSATVRALSKTSLLSLSKNSFDLILEKRPTIGIEILKKIARLMSMNLRRTSAQLADHI